MVNIRARWYGTSHTTKLFSAKMFIIKTILLIFFSKCLFSWSSSLLEKYRKITIISASQDFDIFLNKMYSRASDKALPHTHKSYIQSMSKTIANIQCTRLMVFDFGWYHKLFIIFCFVYEPFSIQTRKTNHITKSLLIVLRKQNFYTFSMLCASFFCFENKLDQSMDAMFSLDNLAIKLSIFSFVHYQILISVGVCGKFPMYHHWKWYISHQAWLISYCCCF